MDKATHRLSQGCRGATHIVKFWEQNEYPQLAANKFFCLKVAEKCGLEVPHFPGSPRKRWRSSSIGSICILTAPVAELRAFCVFNARRTDEKYRGSYKFSIMKRFGEFAASPRLGEDLARLFTLIVINCVLRNGDAHLKNFGIVYDDVEGEARLAPVYDLVTTSVYLPRDSLALTLNGTTRWASTRSFIAWARRAWEALPPGSGRYSNASTVRLPTPPGNCALTSRITGSLRRSATACSMNGSKGLRCR